MVPTGPPKLLVPTIAKSWARRRGAIRKYSPLTITLPSSPWPPGAWPPGACPPSAACSPPTGGGQSGVAITGAGATAPFSLMTSGGGSAAGGPATAPPAPATRATTAHHQLRQVRIVHPPGRAIGLPLALAFTGGSSRRNFHWRAGVVTTDAAGRKSNSPSHDRRRSLRPTPRRDPMRIAIGQLWQETNTFNPLPTTRADFEAFGVLRGDELLAKMADTNEPGGMIQALRQWPEQPELVGLVRLPAWPSGVAKGETTAWLLAEVMESLLRAGPLDAVL